jgi:hypothetical protein
MISAHFCALAVLSVVFAVPLDPQGDPDLTSNPTSVPFAADPSIHVAAIYAAAKTARAQDLASFPTKQDQQTISHIYGDWLNLPGVSAFQFIADMDVDCDGVAVRKLNQVSFAHVLILFQHSINVLCVSSKHDVCILVLTCGREIQAGRARRLGAISRPKSHTSSSPTSSHLRISPQIALVQ